MIVKVFRLIPECKWIVVVNVTGLYLQIQIDFSADRVIISWRVNPMLHQLTLTLMRNRPIK